MRLVTYRHGTQAPRAGAISDVDGAPSVIDLADASDGRLPADLLQLLEAGPEAVDEARRVIAAAGPGRPLGEVQLAAPLARPPKILAAAGNYQAHIVEGGLPPVDKDRIVPKLFLKPSTTIQGPEVPLTLPSVSHEVDWELELAVVIGRRCRDVAQADALDVVAGYSIINDVSARSMDWGVADRSIAAWDGFFDWLNGKWPDGFAPMGPWIVTADEIRDPSALDLRLTVNGQVFQEATTGEMLFDTAELIAFASRFMTLEPGDVIATGTPAGVGATTGTYLRPGDVMEGWIDRIGTLRTPVVAPPTPAA